MDFIPKYVYELVLYQQTIRIFSNEEKAKEFLVFHQEHSLYVADKENYAIRKTILE